jgi:hypothetical protein
MDLTDAFDLGAVIPLQDLLSWGPALWDDNDEGEEFVPNANEIEEEDVDRRWAVKEDNPVTAPAPSKKRQVLEEPDEDIYKKLLEQNDLFDDVEDDDSYDFLADIDGNVELLKKDREDELEVGAAEGEDLEFIQNEGARPFLSEPSTKKRKKNAPMSSPAKGTRSSTATFRFKHPILSMNVSDTQLVLKEQEPTEQQLCKVVICCL